MSEVRPEALGIRSAMSSELPIEHARRVAATLDLPTVVAADDSLPLLWHWAFFTPEAPTATLGSDGHPKIPEGGPSAGLPRRMWAGSRIRAHGPLRVGRPAEQQTRVLSIEPKSGRSGRLLVVTLEHRIVQAGTLVRTEEQDLVYRGAGGAADAPSGPRPEAVEPPPDWVEARELAPPTLLRFSAITFNSHRIHYDLPYATGVEGYGGLVVHGPLTAMLLYHAALRRSSTDPVTFAFRATAPLLAGTRVELAGRGTADGMEVRAIRADGTTCMTARLGFDPGFATT